KFIGIALPLTDLTEEQCLMKDDILGVMQKCYNEMQQIHNIIAKKAKVGLFEKILSVAQRLYDDIKVVLNGCK
ncbi:hypothetical protein, partial [Helicobacter sp. MIT 14-3879]|uniref:hypothetical protein n=1 Tax=Helicobacter sp. MIT 14-3879 TaxID=2040649 RepID=UPI001C6A6830